jgi:hypothetical protein
LFGTAGERGPLVCASCAQIALNVESGFRGYVPRNWTMRERLAVMFDMVRDMRAAD